MIIQKLSVSNLRKIQIFTEKFIPQTNIIVGPNGSGKTSILESIFFISSGKSFRKKYTKAIIQKGKKELKIKAHILSEKEKTLKAFYNEKTKSFFKNTTPIKTTTELIQEISIICISPEEIDIIEEYKKEKQQYFDRIIFKINPKHIEHIKRYNKLLLYRNTLLENNMETQPWDTKIIFYGQKIWEERKCFFNIFLKFLKKTQETLKTHPNYTIIYNPPRLSNEKYLKELNKQNRKNKTETGPHKDIIEFQINNNSLKEHGSQGEKKLFKYILKLTELEIIKTKNSHHPILLLDDFFAKLDSENIMKIFLYFHCKFQTIITTTSTENQTLKNIEKNNKEIKIFKFK